jgi:hypothetical protein
MKKPILNEEISRLRKIMGLTENFEMPSKEEFNFEKSAIESASGEKVVQREFDDYDRPLFYSLEDDNVHYFIGDGDNGPMIIKYNAETGERYPIGDLKDYDEPELSEIAESEISEGSMESGVYYDTTVAHEIKSKVGNLHKIAPYVLEIGDRVIEDISGKVSVYDGGNLVEKFNDVDAFLIGIKYGATPV